MKTSHFHENAIKAPSADRFCRGCGEAGLFTLSIKGGRAWTPLCADCLEAGARLLREAAKAPYLSGGVFPLEFNEP